jgi:hypothetical protein
MKFRKWARNTNKIGLTILKEWITLDSRNTPSTTNLVEEEIVGAPENDDNASMPEQVKRLNDDDSSNNNNNNNNKGSYMCENYVLETPSPIR